MTKRWVNDLRFFNFNKVTSNSSQQPCMAAVVEPKDRLYHVSPRSFNRADSPVQQTPHIPVP